MLDLNYRINSQLSSNAILEVINSLYIRENLLLFVPLKKFTDMDILKSIYENLVLHNVEAKIKCLHGFYDADKTDYLILSIKNLDDNVVIKDIVKDLSEQTKENIMLRKSNTKGNQVYDYETFYLYSYKDESFERLNHNHNFFSYTEIYDGASDGYTYYISVGNEKFIKAEITIKKNEE